MPFFKNILHMLVLFLITQGIITAASNSKEGDASAVQIQKDIPESLKTKLAGLEFSIDNYKNIVVILKSPIPEKISQLREVITEMAESYKNYGLYVYVPVTCGEFSDQLKQLGFDLYDLDKEANLLIYLYRNGRDIPELNYAYTAAGTFLVRTNPKTHEKEILVINEPQKNIANIVCGISEKGESPQETAEREVREEVGINIDKKKLKLIALFHTVRTDKKSCVEYLYVCDEFEGEPRVDGKGVKDCAWISVSEILKEDCVIFGKPFYSLWRQVFKNEFKDQYGVEIKASNVRYI